MYVYIYVCIYLYRVRNERSDIGYVINSFVSFVPNNSFKTKKMSSSTDLKKKCLN